MEEKKDGLLLENLSFRTMKDEDAAEVYNIECESFTDPWPLSAFEKSGENGTRRFYVAQDGNVILAYGAVMTVLDECEILRIAVRKKSRKSGIGSLMLKYMINECYRKKSRFFYLEVRESNIPAIGLYKKFGFSENGRRKDYYTKPVEAAVLMSLIK